MNSLQLINKIKSKSADFTQNINELLHANQAFNRIQKDLLNKQCIDIYELLLKLKIEEETIEEKTAPILAKEELKTNPEVEIPLHNPAPVIFNFEKTDDKNIIEEEEISQNISEPLVQAENFQEVISWADQHQESLDAIVEKVSLQEVVTMPEIDYTKATENKRIQYTVMPEMPKPNPFNNNFAEKEPSYNDKMSQTNPPVLVPLADKTIEAPIDNIKGAINLNKKIALVKILFNENVVEYAKAIERLNNALDKTDAMRIYNELKHQHQWDNENELVLDLEQLITRRFIK